ncbi:histidine phosphatase family protein [soil metagenome]
MGFTSNDQSDETNHSMKKFLTFFSIILFLSFAAFRFCHASFSRKNPEDAPGTHTIYIMRHAQSNHEEMNIGDLDRPILESGKKEAEEMGEYLFRHGEKIDLVIASPAMRTRMTAEIVCKKTGYDFQKVKWDTTIYRCSTEDLEDCIKGIDEKYKTVLLVGHNNSVTIVSGMLQNDKVINDMPTAGITAISFGITAWKDVKDGSGKLVFYKTPAHY